MNKVQVGQYYNYSDSTKFSLVTKIENNLVYYNMYSENGMKKNYLNLNSFQILYPTLCKKRNTALYKVLNQ